MGEGLDKKLGRTFSRPERSYDQDDYLDEEDRFSDSGFYESVSHKTLGSSVTVAELDPNE